MPVHTVSRTRSLRLLLASGLIAVAGGAALAQGVAPESMRNIESAGTFRNITATGVTKPPGRALGGERPRETDTPSAKERVLDRRIETQICVGCN
ncbi:hypothetical protein [Methylobacterium gossipiicola]|uniref:Uncharacterized protein n=1 Tax=Methylobacterium gossipiicola TaxID=582675 RepID=A0A1I2WGQ9_9HYPH|nr:hypothetical protein [Methylobacterium gossipiicola]SFH00454.1 hypothetical protein SAMN05192565_1239 [Methylobacterium gossipiicola]